MEEDQVIIGTRKFKLSRSKSDGKLYYTQIESDRPMSPKDVVDEIKNINDKITEYRQQQAQLVTQGERIDSAIKDYERLLKVFEKHKESSEAAQIAKAKNIFEEVKAEAKQKVEDTYRYDKGLTEQMNSVQKFHQFRHYVREHPTLNKEVSRVIIDNLLFADEDFLRFETSPFAK